MGYTAVKVEVRLGIHVSHHQGFTTESKEWFIVYTEQSGIKAAARQRERQLKA